MKKSIRTLIEVILKENPSHKPFLEKSVNELDTEQLEELAHYLGYCAKRSIGVDYIAESYNTIVQDTFREQIYFMRHKSYRYSTYAEAAKAVYDDPAYMEKYMYGLAITLFFWPAHRQLKTFFEHTLPQDKPGDYLEIGPGHGFFFMHAMQSTGYTTFTGVDISQKSVDMTCDIIESGDFGHYPNYTIECQDFLAADLNDKPYEALVMGEVLEHVEDPNLFLREIKRKTTPDSYIYISTCMNAPAIDHLALFTSPEHLHSIVENAGLCVVDDVLIPYPGLSIQETIEKQMAMNTGMVLTHQ